MTDLLSLHPIVDGRVLGLVLGYGELLEVVRGKLKGDCWEFLDDGFKGGWEGLGVFFLLIE